MKLAVIGDVHLGASANLGVPHEGQYVNSRLIDYRATLEKTIDVIAEAGTSQLIFTGDVFESRSPSLVQQKVFSEALHHAISHGIKEVHIIVGNHDQARRADHSTTLSYLKELNLPNIHVYDEITAIELQDERGISVANLIALPFRDRKWYGLESYNEAITAVRKDFEYVITSIENQLPKIVIPHMAIEGTFIGDDEYLELYGENQLFLPKEMFKDCSLVLGGHIHEPMILQEAGPYIAYVGSMEKRGAFEKHNKLYAFIDTETLKVEYQKEPCREIYEIKLDYSYEVLGEGLEKRICDDISEFVATMETDALDDAIVKIGLKICSADDKYVQPKQLYRFLKDHYHVHNCVEIRPEIFSARQARNDKITEQVSDTEAFKLHLETAIEDVELRAEVLECGLDIIRTAEAEEAR